MSQLEHIGAIEKRLREAADTLRANSNYASNEYFLPVMGLVFLRHAYSRYLAVKDEIAAVLAGACGYIRPSGPIRTERRLSGDGVHGPDTASTEKRGVP